MWTEAVVSEMQQATDPDMAVDTKLLLRTFMTTQRRVLRSKYTEDVRPPPPSACCARREPMSSQHYIVPLSSIQIHATVKMTAVGSDLYLWISHGLVPFTVLNLNTGASAMLLIWNRLLTARRQDDR
jgi:hypothetical protein